MIPTVAVTRYVTPLREGGSLPGLVEAEDLGTYVCKFHGAGQGVRVLVAEIIVAHLAARISVPTPRLVGLELDPQIARYEADEEVQDLLNASVGLNLGVDFLPGAFGFDHEASIEPEPAARILWLDAFTANVDRSWRNPNLLVWHGQVWAIDHGASLYFHHAWDAGVGDPERFAEQPWNASDHVLRDQVQHLGDVDAQLRALVDRDAITEAIAQVPEAWLRAVPRAQSAEALRDAYAGFLLARLRTRSWLPEVAR